VSCKSKPKNIKARDNFPNDDAAGELIWLALRNITSEWSRAAHDWKMAMNQFAIIHDDRFERVVSVD
jgi:putative transposase